MSSGRLQSDAKSGAADLRSNAEKLRDDRLPLGVAIGNLRRLKKWRQSDLADRAGLTRPMVSLLENGSRAVSIDVLRAALEALEVPLADLIQSIADGRAAQPEAASAEHRDAGRARRRKRS